MNRLFFGARRLVVAYAGAAQIDLDTIDVSNLNRQFLFRKQHVRQPKSVVAREAALRMCPEANIVAYHDNVKNPRFGPSFLREFDVVLNALDNLDARRHVNRCALAGARVAFACESACVSDSRRHRRHHRQPVCR